MERELEMKLRLSDEAAARLARQPAVKHLLAGTPRTTRLLTVYYDTPDNFLALQGMALSVRHAGRRRIQTLKVAADGHDGEALQRHDEWSAPIQGDVPDLTRLGHPHLRDRLAREGCLGELREVFRAEIKRRIFPVTVGEARIELALDSGWIRAGDASEKISEVELELKAGAPSAIFDLASRLVAELPMHVEHRTKADRGYALAEGRRPQPVMAGTLELDAEWSAWRGFVVIVRNCLEQLYSNEVAILAGSEVEAVHQLRVAVRRMRAAFSAFGPVRPTGALAPFKAELRWLQQTLGPARDWDVFIIETLAPLRAEIGDHAGLAALASAAEMARQAAYAQVRATLGSRRYALFQIGLERWLDTDGAQSDAMKLSTFGKRALAKRDRKILDSGRKVGELPDEQLHDVRIAAKKARYNAEFFRSLFTRKATKRYIRALRDVQGCLGALNDAAVAKALLDAVDGADPGALSYVKGWFAARIVDGKRRIGDVWEEYRRAPRFWAD
ncbi:MAG: CHAD domain-containing protein [Alphaproteobacteria bacterium]